MSCGCKKDEPPVDSLSAIWRDPMEYDMQKHGPPYLPVTASQRVEVQQFTKRQAAYYDVGPKLVPEGSPYLVLGYLLAGLRTLYMVHQTAHWQTRGDTSYADHTLFQRIYEESLEGIDAVAERLVGLTTDPKQVALCSQIQIISRLVEMVHGDTVPDAPSAHDLVLRSLNGELALLGGLAKAKQMMQNAGVLTDGLEDLLQGTASKHEEFVYLLKQRVAQPAYTYDRQ